MESLVLTVSDAVALVNQTLEYAYPSIIVEGEVGSFKVSKDKYVFFDLKDAGATLGCFMMVYGLRTPIEDGMRVRVVAQPRLTAWGKFSLNVREVTPSGEGQLKRSLELLRAKLEAEGLFAIERKRLLPALPQRVGVISSVQAAGYHDFVTILGQRWGGLELLVADVQVQGASASQQIIRAIHYFNELAEPPEVLVIVRGGGSAEDLFVFNEEPLVRAVAGSRVPTLVGVGHEVDTSLCDLAADVRAATPTNAAQLLVPDKREVLGDIRYAQERMSNALEQRKGYIEQQIAGLGEALLASIRRCQNDLTRRCDQHEALLKQLNPRTALNRGYALVWNANGQVSKGTEVKAGDTLRIELEKVCITAGVEDVKAK